MFYFSFYSILSDLDSSPRINSLSEAAVLGLKKVEKLMNGPDITQNDFDNDLGDQGDGGVRSFSFVPEMLSLISRMMSLASLVNQIDRSHIPVFVVNLIKC
jgi:hypothetical protein